VGIDPGMLATRELHLVNLELAQGEQPDPTELELPVKPGNVLDAAPETVERLTDDDVDHARTDVGQHAAEPGPVAPEAGDFGIE
jgi:hypothetical protein